MQQFFVAFSGAVVFETRKPTFEMTSATFFSGSVVFETRKPTFEMTYATFCFAFSGSVVFETRKPTFEMTSATCFFYVFWIRRFTNDVFDPIAPPYKPGTP